MLNMLTQLSSTVTSPVRLYPTTKLFIIIVLYYPHYRVNDN